MPSIGKVVIGAILVVVGYMALATAVLAVLALCFQFLIPGATAGAYTPGFMQCISIAALTSVVAGILAIPHKQ